MNKQYEKVKDLESSVTLALSEGNIAAVEGLMITRNFPGPFIACLYLSLGMLIYRRNHFKHTFTFAFGYTTRYRNMYSKETLKLWRDKYKATGQY